jgi:hypothetical protein
MFNKFFLIGVLVTSSVAMSMEEEIGETSFSLKDFMHESPMLNDIQSELREINVARNSCMSAEKSALDKKWMRLSYELRLARADERRENPELAFFYNQFTYDALELTRELKKIWEEAKENFNQRKKELTVRHYRSQRAGVKIPCNIEEIIKDTLDVLHNKFQNPDLSFAERLQLESIYIEIELGTYRVEGILPETVNVLALQKRAQEIDVILEKQKYEESKSDKWVLKDFDDKDS